jgi:hypothetical protein
MQHRDIALPEAVEAAARRDGVLDFKDEGENEEGLPFGKLTLRSSTEPVFPDGRWVTKRQALRIAAAWGVHLLEY